MEAPTGPFRSFQRRGWPMAHYDDAKESVAAWIISDDDYVPRNIKTGNHTSLRLVVADHSPEYAPSWKRLVFKKEFKTLAEAKAGLLEILKRHSEYAPRTEI